MKQLNAAKTCLNCPSAIFIDPGTLDLIKNFLSNKDKSILQNIKIQCKRRPALENFIPAITFEDCEEWLEGKYGYQLKNMRVMILGIDGYLGWPLALRLGKLGFQVSGIDNYTRRDTVMEKGAHSIVPIGKMTNRLKAATEIHSININFRRLDIRDRYKLREFIDEEKPEAIVHYAEIPSAPYSMVDMEHSIMVQDNNTLGTLGLLWMIKDLVPNCNLIKLGTMGEYGSPKSGRAIFEGMFPEKAVLKWLDKEWPLTGEMIPKDPVSFYHISKVQDTYNIYEACKFWGLRSIDIMQGIIYGVHTDELSVDERLRTRFDIDEWFGTVMNRFVAQAIIDIPLSIYGEGEQIKGFIALEDAMECMVRLINSPPNPAEYEVVNQLSGVHKLKEIAEIVARIGTDKYKFDVKIQRIENPRVENENHPLEVYASKLPNTYGFKQIVSVEKEIERMFELLMQPEIKKRILEKKHTIMPKTKWSGEKEEAKVLEYYKPKTKKVTGYKGILHKDKN